jgi:ribonucrease Y
MSLLANIFEGAAFLSVGAVLCYLLMWWKDHNFKKTRVAEADSILEKARREAENLLRDARLAANEEALKAREEAGRTFAAQRVERAEMERRLSEREALLNSQLARIIDAEKALKIEKESLDKRLTAFERERREVDRLARERLEQLQALSGLSAAEARQQFLKEIEIEAMRDAGNLARRIADEAKARAEEKARQIISVAIQRYAGQHTLENTTATIELQGDDIKGRIIGREGRNIRAFEAAAGVTILVDDTPGTVVISGFDPIRREVAREAMLRLIQDGRIHPTRIEEIVAQVTQEMDGTMMRLGEEAVARAGLPPMHLEVVKLLGRLHFRHSYSQNILDHSVEVAHLMALMAAELGLDPMIARRAGLLHDIGKAVNHEVEGPHAIAGADFIKRFGESEAVVNAVASHHNDVPPLGPMGILVSAADAVSASRPGARSENMTTYLKRIEDLEKIATSFPGVEKSFAVHAGRELRVFVQPGQVNDEQAFAMARNIALKIEGQMQYPGQIRITVIRETRCVEVAK